MVTLEFKVNAWKINNIILSSPDRQVTICAAILGILVKLVDAEWDKVKYENDFCD